MLGAFTLRGEAGPAIEPIHGAVDSLVGAAEVGGHQVGVVKVGQRRVRMGRASVQDRLR